MNIKDHTNPDKLEYYSFLWSMLRMLIAAVALFLGGISPALKLIPSSSSGLYSLAVSLLTVAWIISGVVAVYLLYRWFTGNKTLFGGKKPLDTAAFFVMVISGFNLGLTGITGSNIGMSIFGNTFFLLLGGLIYLATVGYLFKRWNASGKKLF